MVEKPSRDVPLHGVESPEKMPAAEKVKDSRACNHRGCSPADCRLDAVAGALGKLNARFDRFQRRR